MRGEEKLMARPGKYGLCSIILITVIILLALASNSAWACVGARQMAMGGTFIGIADDPSAVYWNPAGIAMLEERGIHVTSTLNNRDTYDYDDFLVYIPPKYRELALGFSMIRRHLGELYGGGLYQAANWFTCSIAAPVADGFSVGANIRYETYTKQTPGGEPVSGFSWGLDLGLLYKVTSKISLGCLLQDIGFQDLQWADGTVDARRVNIRPGIGYRPDPYTLIACDIYDLSLQDRAPETSGDNRLCLRFGLERWLTPNLAARFGYYGIKTGDGAITYGIALHKGRYAVDYAYLDVATVPGHSGLGGTHQIGVTMKF